MLFGDSRPARTTMSQWFDLIRMTLEHQCFQDQPLYWRGYLRNDEGVLKPIRSTRLGSDPADQMVSGYGTSSFDDVAIYTSDMKKTGFPALYARFHKYWELDNDECIPTAIAGAASSITVAVRNPPSEPRSTPLYGLGIELAKNVRAVYGFMERNRRWGLPVGQESDGLEQLIDYRWHEVPGIYYQNGGYSMRRTLAHLYWGNFITARHCLVPISELHMHSGVSSVTHVSENLYLVELAKDYDEASPAGNSVSRAFRMTSR